ncbi:orotidine-5'-phosphate decarboxylase [Kocuria turfanensis]|uniref:Orotidine 5'-phosphate decarboxylase n=1 Tax=Kocuria turfanensis TaxID=388357 RepID=A0A512ICR6_9MICC|nr:orotidine-5'-phosphate decarboxylase [Kocuria turfanensis]GEO95493.1 orotidine 5'-phosphate decarboxylase [Kocuria turfanensis]
MPEHPGAQLPAPGRAPFGARLARAMDAHGPLCVGIDPHPGLLEAWGLPRTAEGLRRFSLTVLEAAAGRAAAVKPQVALYESYGAAGFAVLEELLGRARAAGLLTVADAKRGDIGSTMEAYAAAWLEEGSPLAADAVTLSPYLGFESLRPALDLAARTGRGTFVLALTSNPEGRSVQHVGGAGSVARAVCSAAAAENARVLAGAGGAEPPAGTAAAPRTGLGPCGLVVGATVGDALAQLGIDLAGVRGPLLAPGYGAQGARAEDLPAVFGAAAGQVLATSSRAILRRGPSVPALREAIERSAGELAAALG